MRRDAENRMRVPDVGVRARTSTGRWVLLATVLGSGMAGIDASVVNIALPSIGRDLDATFVGLQWTVSAYTLTLASLILWGGAMGDRWGRRRVFLVGVCWFTASSLLCAAAPDLRVLVLARTLQGIGGALLTPASLAIIESSFAPEDRSRAIGTWAAFSGVATAVAPFVGGWLLDVASWRWVFIIDVPLSFVVAVVAVRHVPESRQQTDDAQRSGASDWLGAVLTVVGLGGVTWAVLGTTEHGDVLERVVAAGTGVLAMVLFVLVERRSSHPLVPLEMFSDVVFSITNLTTFVLYGAIGCFFFLLVIELQAVAGFTPLAAGAALLPVTLMTLLLSSGSGALAQRIGPRPQMTAGPLLCALGVLLALRVGPRAGYLSDVLPVVLVFGLGLATFVAPLTSTALSSAAADRAGIASGVNNAVARSGSLLAVATLPVLTGLTGAAEGGSTRFVAAFDRSMAATAALLVLGAVVAGVGLGRGRAAVVPRCRPDPVAGSPGH